MAWKSVHHSFNCLWSCSITEIVLAQIFCQFISLYSQKSEEEVWVDFQMGSQCMKNLKKKVSWKLNNSNSNKVFKFSRPIYNQNFLHFFSAKIQTELRFNAHETFFRNFDILWGCCVSSWLLLVLKVKLECAKT